MDIGLVVLSYLDRCESVGRQQTFSDLATALYSEGATADEVFHGMRWLFSSDYAVRTRPNEFTLSESGRIALEEFRRVTATLH